MNLTNSQIVAADTAIAAAVSAERAEGKLDKAAAELIESGFKPDFIAQGGSHLAWMQERVARATLSEKQYATWANVELASSFKKEGKNVKTERGGLIDRVNGRIRRIREAMKRVSDPAESGSSGSSGSNKKGAGGRKSTPSESFFKALDSYIQRFAKDDASDKFSFDPRLARERLVALVKELK
jgi:hypothetical protein